MEMDQNDALLEGPPPPEQAPDLEFFPALITPTRAKLPAGAKSYLSTYIPKQAFEIEFEGVVPLYVPPTLDAAFKGRLSAFPKEVDRLLEGVAERAGWGMSALVEASKLDGLPDGVREHMTRAMLASGQSIAGINYVRRLAALREFWGHQHTDAARTQIKLAADNQVFVNSGDLFGPQFAENCRATTTAAPRAPPAPVRDPQPSNRGNARGGSRGSRGGYRGAYRGTFRARGFQPYFNRRSRGNNYRLVRNEIAQNSMNKDDEQHDGTMHEAQTTQISLDSQAHLAQWSNDGHYNVNVLVPGEQVNRVGEQLNEIIATNANKQLIVGEQLRSPSVGEQPNGSKENESSFFRAMAPYRGPCSQLGEPDDRPNDLGLGKGSSVRVATPTAVPAKKGSVCDSAKGTGTSRQTSTRSDRFGNRLRMPRSKIISWSLPKTKKRRQLSSDSRLIRIESMLGEDTLQNGVVAGRDRPVGTRRLDVKNRPQFSLLCGTRTSGLSAVSCLPLERESLHVHPNMLRSEPGTQNIYQNAKAGLEMDEEPRSQNSRVYRRLLGSALIEPRMQTLARALDGETSIVGIQGEPEKERDRTNTADRVFRSNNKLKEPSAVATGEEERQNHRHTTPNDTEKGSLDEAGSFSIGHSGSNETNVSADTALLQKYTRLADSPITNQRDFLQVETTQRNSYEGTGILAGTTSQGSTTSTEGVPGPSSQTAIGCITRGMGCPSRRGTNPSSVVDKGKRPAYKRPGIASNREGTGSVQAHPERTESPSDRRQRNKPSVHIQERGYERPSLDTFDHSHMGNGSEGRDHPGDGTYPREGQHNPRLLVSPGILDRGVGLEPKRPIISEGGPDLGPVTSGPICQPMELQSAELHNLENAAQPAERLSPSMDGGRLCVSTVHASGTSAEESASRQVLTTPDSPKVGGPILVLQSDPNAGGLSENAETPPVHPAGPSGEPTSDGKQLKTDGLAGYRKRLEAEGVSTEVSKLVTEAWAEGTVKQYQSAWNTWAHWCESVGQDAEKQSPPVIGLIAQFLTDRFKAGISYNQLNTYRSMFSAYLPRVDHKSVGCNPVIEKLMKSFYRQNPPRPRYEKTWDIDKVVEIWDVPNRNLSTFELSIKTCTLLTIATLGRGDDIRNLSHRNHKIIRDSTGVIVAMELLRLKLPKQQRSGLLKPVRIAAVSVPRGQNVCPVTTCMDYIKESANKRPAECAKLFITSTKPYRPVAPKTITRWLLRSMEKAGIDTTVFKAHSMCAASTSKKKASGMSSSEIMKNGRWSQTSTMEKYYIREID